MVLSAEDDPRVQEVLSSIRGIPDFPKQVSTAFMPTVQW